ncbi:MAG TPA: ferrous iron transport protein A, partial [Thermococcus paralvinellae]|nr:ferrous iron transport protein A [Thermococcus paralvinellae]
MNMHARLSMMREGERGVVVDIEGGAGVRQRLLG